MKKLFLSLAVLPFICSYGSIYKNTSNNKLSFSPIKQGKYIFGTSLGSLGYSFEGKNFNINLSPQVGYFFNDGIAMGLSTELGYQSAPHDKDVYTYKLMPFARYYFREGAKPNGRFFGETQLGITGSSHSNSSVSLGFGINGGYAHFISKKVALELIGGYNYSKARIANSNSSNGLGVSAGIKLHLDEK